MNCKHCGKEIPNDSKFCPECGSQISEESQNKTGGLKEKKLQNLFLFPEYSGELIDEFETYKDLPTAVFQGGKYYICPNCEEYNDCLKSVDNEIIYLNDPEMTRTNKSYLVKIYELLKCSNCGYEFMMLKDKENRRGSETTGKKICVSPSELCKICYDNDTIKLPTTNCDKCGLPICEDHLELNKFGYHLCQKCTKVFIEKHREDFCEVCFKEGTYTKSTEKCDQCGKGLCDKHKNKKIVLSPKIYCPECIAK